MILRVRILTPEKELWKIPETVLKEAINNAFAHRDYYDKDGRGEWSFDGIVILR